MLKNYGCVAMLLVVLAAGAGAAPAPIFDVHTHYKWDQAEIISPQQVLQRLDEAGVAKAMVIGTPPKLALQLKELAPQRIIAFYGPYLVGGERFSWQFRKSLVEEARAGLASGQYQGIGELHLIGGMATRWDRSEVFLGLLELAREYDVPLMVHTEYASIEPTVSMCRANPGNRFLLAHAGGVLPPRKVEEILLACPNLVMDLAARDSWRYLRTPIVDAQGSLLPGWRDLIERYPARFMIGSDPVWPIGRGISWDVPDTGWEEMPRYIAFHRRWLSDLPPEVAQKLRWDNAQRFFSPD